MGRFHAIKNTVLFCWFHEEPSTSMEFFHWTKGSREEKAHLEYNFLHTKKNNGSFKIWSLKGSLGNQKLFFYGITAKYHFLYGC